MSELASIPDPREFRLRSAEYFPWIDVLRALCFLMVFFNHFGIQFQLWDLVLSRAGVALFFAISGWLITKIILRILEREDFLSVFYSRRLLRIYPTYFLVLIAYVAILPLVNPPTREDFLEHLPWFATLNFGLFPEPGNLYAHSWSIATEERFYIVWPLLCVVCKRFKIPLLVPLMFATLFMADSVLAIPQVNSSAWAPILPCSHHLRMRARVGRAKDSTRDNEDQPRNSRARLRCLPVDRRGARIDVPSLRSVVRGRHRVVLRDAHRSSAKDGHAHDPPRRAQLRHVLDSQAPVVLHR
jgi:hypothetical protein